MKVDDFFRDKLLKHCDIDKNKIKGSLEIANKFLERAEGNFKMEYYDVAFTLAYNSIFHSARALLFSLGVKERSHFAMLKFLIEKFKENKELYDSLIIADSYRVSRHAIQYDGEMCSKLDAEEAILDARKFLKSVKKYFNEAKV